MFYVGKSRDLILEDIMVYKLGDKTNSPSAIFAPRGRLKVDLTNLVLIVQLFDAKGVWFEGDHGMPVSGDLTLDEFKIVSRTETPLPAGKGTLITVITHTKATMKTADGETKHRFVNHDVLLRHPDGKIVYVSGAEAEE